MNYLILWNYFNIIYEIVKILILIFLFHFHQMWLFTFNTKGKIGSNTCWQKSDHFHWARKVYYLFFNKFHPNSIFYWTSYSSANISSKPSQSFNNLLPCPVLSVALSFYFVACSVWVKKGNWNKKIPFMMAMKNVWERSIHRLLISWNRKRMYKYLWSWCAVWTAADDCVFFKVLFLLQ